MKKKFVDLSIKASKQQVSIDPSAFPRDVITGLLEISQMYNGVAVKPVSEWHINLLATNIERDIFNKIVNGSEEAYLPSGDGHTFFDHHALWMEAFSRDFDIAPTLPYETVKIKLNTRTEKDMLTFIDSLGDCSLAKSLTKHCATKDILTLSYIEIPRAAYIKYGIPSRLLPICDMQYMVRQKSLVLYSLLATMDFPIPANDNFLPDSVLNYYILDKPKRVAVDNLQLATNDVMSHGVKPENNLIVAKLFTFDSDTARGNKYFSTVQVAKVMNMLRSKIENKTLYITSTVQDDLGVGETAEETIKLKTLLDPKKIIGTIDKVEYDPIHKIIIGYGHIYDDEIYNECGMDNVPFSEIYYRITHTMNRTSDNIGYNIASIVAWDINLPSAKYLNTLYHK